VSTEYDAILADFKRMVAEGERMIAEGEQLRADGCDGMRSIEKLIARRAAENVPGGTQDIVDSSRAITTMENYKTLPERVLDLLNSRPARAFKISEVRAAVRHEDLYSVSGTLSRLAQERRIARCGRGLYRAASGPPSTKEERRILRQRRMPGFAPVNGAPDIPTVSNGNGGRADRAPAGTWVRAVLNACNAINGELTVKGVMDQMTFGGFEWNIKNPRITVTKTLNRLVRDRKIELVELGANGHQSKYRKIAEA
jgi:hypothetical protein